MTPTEEALAHAVAALAALNGQYANVIAQAAELIEGIEQWKDWQTEPAHDALVAWLEHPNVQHARSVVVVQR